MRKINLTQLRNNQQLPRISYEPIKILEDKIFFAKNIHTNKHIDYVEGIYIYQNDQLTKIDYGFHTKNPMDYCLFVPSEYEDMLSIDEIKYVLYSIVTENKTDDTKASIIIYAIDIETLEQIEVFSIRFNRYDFSYYGFRILSDTYVLIELENILNPEIKEWNKLLMLNIYTNEIIEIQDIYTKYTTGMLYIDSNNKYVYVDEMYMNEDDETAILTTDMYEVEPNDDETDINPFANSIKVSALSDFILDAKIGKVKYDMKNIDSICDDGILRVIGTTKDYIYYKKSKHQVLLKDSNEFKERVLYGKEEVFSINKSTQKLEKITNLDLGSIFSFDQDIYNKIYDEDNKIRIVDVETGRQRYVYEKENSKEEFSDFLLNRYLLVDIDRMKSSKKVSKVIDIETGELELLAKEIIFIKDTFFYETL